MVECLLLSCQGFLSRLLVYDFVRKKGAKASTGVPRGVSNA
jgi:hypothetical protein